MATTSSTTVRRFAGIAITLLFCLCLSWKAAGQDPAPLVTASSATGLEHKTGSTWGAIQQTAISKDGDWLVVDTANSAVYEFPAGGQPAIVLAAPGSLGGGWSNPGIAIDPGNNLYLEANWNNCLLMFPWDPVAKKWTGLSTMTPSNPNTALCTNSGSGNSAYAFAQYGLAADGAVGFAGWYQPWGIAIGNNNNLIVGTQTNGQFIFSLPVTGWTNPKPAMITWQPINNLTKRPISVAQDQAGNIYFVQDSGGLAGVYQVPAGLTLTSDKNLLRVDPNLPAVTGVVTDSKGNLYISDSQKGVVMVPNTTGTPETDKAVVITSVPAQGEVAVDWARNTVYVPTTQQQANGQKDVAKVNFGYAELGSSAVKSTAPTGANVLYQFNGSTAVSRFVVIQDGATIPDFAITGGTCRTGSAYAAKDSCLETISFTPSSVGSISARLLLQKADPVAEGAPDRNDVITKWCAASGTISFTAANSLVAGELIQFSAPDENDPLHGLDSRQFNVLAAGLVNGTNGTFAIKSSDVTTCPATDHTSSATAATIQAYAYTTLSSMILHGVGIGANIQATPAQQSAMGGDLMAPSQLAVNRQGDIYVADPGQGKVLMFAAGASTSSKPLSVGTGLKSPTGIAIDGAGDIFIADNNNGVGSIYEIPYRTSGLITDDGQVTLATGLGPNLKLALDTTGTLYAADPSNGRVVKFVNVGGVGPSLLGQAEIMLTAGFTAPSAVAVDHNGNLFVIDGENLFEIAVNDGALTTLLDNLNGATGLAVDPSGAVYVTSMAGTVRIPFVGGALDPANQTAIAADVAGTSAVAIDIAGNVYLVQNAGGVITVVLTKAALALPSPPDLTSATNLPATITNSGNAPLIVTGYSNSTDDVNPFNAGKVAVTNFTAQDGTCLGDSTAPSTGIPAGGTCSVQVNFQPGPGAEGPLTGQVYVASRAVNEPSLTIDTSGVGLPLSTSGTVISVSGAAEVINAPMTITVAPKTAGGAVPTGEIAVNFQTWTVDTPSSGPNAGKPTIEPEVATIVAPLDADGKATVQMATMTTPVLAGSQTFNVQYIGDRVYGRSVGTQSHLVAKSAITGIALPAMPDKSDKDLPFVIAGTGSGTTPYDGSVTPWQYQFKMKVETPLGVPTGTITVMDDSSTCPAGTSASGIGTATCNLTGYKGVACPQSAASALLTIQNAGTPSGAQAQFSTTCLWNVPQGTTYSPVIYTHYITPVYSGDANFLEFQGPTPTLFQSIRGPAVQITETGNAASKTTAPSLSVSAGSSASIDLTITSLLGYGFAGRNTQLNDSNFPVSLTCDIPLPHAACAITYDNSIVDPNQITAPNSVQIPCPAGSTTASQLADGSVSCTPGHAKVTVYTNVAVGTTTARNARAASVTLAALFGFGMIGLFFRRRSFEKQRLLLMVLLVLISGALAVTLTACSTTNLSPDVKLTTTPGTYNMTITAQPVGTQCIPLTGAGSNCTTSSGQTGVFVYGSENQVSLPFYVTVKVQ